MRSVIHCLAFAFVCVGCAGEPVVGGRVGDAANDLLSPDEDAPFDVAPTDVSDEGVPLDVATADVSDEGVPLDVATADVSEEDVLLDVAQEVFRCTTSGDCVAMAEMPVCDPSTGRCVACTAADDRCPADRHCDGASFMCVAGCRADEGCPSGRRCDATAHACVECVTDAHCPAGRVCAGNACVPGCNATQPCAMGNTCCAMACVDTRTNVGHCGACGARCDLANATARCTEGRCAVDTCTAGFADCDGDSANGCETDTRTSTSHCGTCGQACTPGSNQRAVCEAGTCTLSCTTGFADCDGDSANGCETDTRTSTSHCGACRAACAVSNGTPACRAGRCEVASCATGFADCDEDSANGCEVDTRTSTSHCGACGRRCGAGEDCVAGVCNVPLEVSGCRRGAGGTAAGANVFRESCRVRGRVGVISGAVATAASVTLRIPFAGLPSGARVIRAFLYRQTYDRTSSYLSTWSLAGRDLTPTTDIIGTTSTGSPVQVARVEITELVRAATQGTDGARAMALTQTPDTSSGGFGWWMIYEAPSLPERTVVVYDGMHTDQLSGNGAFTFDGFRASGDPPTATFHVYGGGDNENDASSVARLNPGTALTVDDVTNPGAGSYAGVQVEPLDDRMRVGATSVPVEFTLRNYSAVSFALLEVGTGSAAETCTPGCPSGQICESGRCFPSEGCRASMRRGFTDVTRFPDIAACGARAPWELATSLTANVCAAGWHPCTADDVTRVTGAAPDFLTPRSFGWIVWVDGSNNTYGTYPTARCAGASPAVANLRGTGGCTPSGVFPEGWRLALDADNWSWSHARTGACVEHAIHRCAYPGGTIAQQRGHTLCCRDTP